MPRLAPINTARLRSVSRAQSGVVTRRQLLDCAVTESAVRYRCRSDGPWQPVLPGVYLTTRGQLSHSQRSTAAYLFARRAIAVTGPAALAWHKISRQPVPMVDVLVPLSSTQRDAGFARLHRTGVVPAPLLIDGCVRYVPVPRAVADTARLLADADGVRAVVAGAVQQGRVLVSQLAAELDDGPVRGSATLRQVLAEVADGVRSVAEADLRTLIRRSGLPEPCYNADLYVGGKFLARPDAWWPQAGVAAEVDSRAWHLSPADWDRTIARHSRMSAYGIIVLHFPPRRLRAEPKVVAAEIRSALAAGHGQLPQVRTRRAS